MISTKKKAVYTQIYLEDIMEQLEQEFEKAFGNENCDYQEILQKIKFLILKNYFKGGKSWGYGIIFILGEGGDHHSCTT
jgi:hypothetical protein